MTRFDANQKLTAEQAAAFEQLLKDGKGPSGSTLTRSLERIGGNEVLRQMLNDEITPQQGKYRLEGLLHQAAIKEAAQARSFNEVING